MSVPSEAATRLAQLIERLAFRVARCLHHPAPDQVHDVRVAIRRLDQALKIFSRWLPTKPTRRIRARLDRVLKRAAEVRDCDIATELIAQLQLRVSATVVEALRSRRESAVGRLENVLRRLRKSEFSSKWRGRLELAAADRRSPERFGSFARELLPEAAEEFIAAGTELAAHPHSKRALHTFRISAKRFRYTMEAFADLYGPGIKSRLASVREVQTVLGNLNDCVTTRRLLVDLGASRASVRPLRVEEADRLTKFQKLWPELFSETEPRNWRRFLERVRAPARAVKASG
jgi:CHAD domain-containing protein